MEPSQGVPPPPDLGRVVPLVESWPRSTPIVRVFSSKRRPHAFNPGSDPPRVQGRFHFFADAGGAIVPVLYGSDHEDGAISETVFHDVPVRGDLRVVLESRLDSLSLVTLRPGRDLRLVQLLGHGLRRLRVGASSLTDTEAAEYPHTVAWARAIHAAIPEADGLVWMSRQFNAAKALVLFGDRVAARELTVEDVPLPLRAGPGRVRVERAANEAGIVIV